MGVTKRGKRGTKHTHARTIWCAVEREVKRNEFDARANGAATADSTTAADAATNGSSASLPSDPVPSLSTTGDGNAQTSGRGA